MPKSGLVTLIIDDFWRDSHYSRTLRFGQRIEFYKVLPDLVKKKHALEDLLTPNKHHLKLFNSLKA